jgi:hypothetical protein
VAGRVNGLCQETHTSVDSTAASEPKDFRSQQHLEIEYLGGSSGNTKIRDVELVCDERAESTGFGEGVGPPHTCLAGFGFSHMTQSSGSPKPPRCGLRQQP